MLSAAAVSGRVVSGLSGAAQGGAVGAPAARVLAGRAVVRPAIGVLLGEIRRTGTLSQSSIDWVRRNAQHLAAADVQRLVDAVDAQAQRARGLSTGGALVQAPLGAR